MAIAAAIRALLSLCMILELLGILLAICFAQAHYTRGQPPSVLTKHALRVPMVLILMGVVGLCVALVVETIETSLGIAVTMCAVLFFGVMLCVLVLVCGLGGWVDRRAGAVNP
jgi:uncharacterized membrane protein YcjF (UPF0283 family)